MPDRHGGQAGPGAFNNAWGNGRVDAEAALKCVDPFFVPFKTLLSPACADPSSRSATSSRGSRTAPVGHHRVPAVEARSLPAVEAGPLPASRLPVLCQVSRLPNLCQLPARSDRAARRAGWSTFPQRWIRLRAACGRLDAGSFRSTRRSRQSGHTDVRGPGVLDPRSAPAVAQVRCGDFDVVGLAGPYYWIDDAGETHAWQPEQAASTEVWRDRVGQYYWVDDAGNAHPGRRPPAADGRGGASAKRPVTRGAGPPRRAEGPTPRPRTGARASLAGLVATCSTHRAGHGRRRPSTRARRARRRMSHAVAVVTLGDGRGFVVKELLDRWTAARARPTQERGIYRLVGGSRPWRRSSPRRRPGRREPVHRPGAAGGRRERREPRRSDRAGATGSWPTRSGRLGRGTNGAGRSATRLPVAPVPWVLRSLGDGSSDVPPNERFVAAFSRPVDASLGAVPHRYAGALWRSSGVVHGDLRFDNCLVSPYGPGHLCGLGVRRPGRSPVGPRDDPPGVDLRVSGPRRVVLAAGPQRRGSAAARGVPGGLPIGALAAGRPGAACPLHGGPPAPARVPACRARESGAGEPSGIAIWRCRGCCSPIRRSQSHRRRPSAPAGPWRERVALATRAAAAVSSPRPSTRWPTRRETPPTPGRSAGARRHRLVPATGTSTSARRRSRAADAGRDRPGGSPRGRARRERAVRGRLDRRPCLVDRPRRGRQRHPAALLGPGSTSSSAAAGRRSRATSCAWSRASALGRTRLLGGSDVVVPRGRRGR